MLCELDRTEIGTAAGTYTVRWLHDDYASHPEDDGFTLLTNKTADRRIDIREGDTASEASRVVQRVLDRQAGSAWGDMWDYERRSGAAVVRYLRLAGKRGVTLVDADYRPVEASANRFDRFYGIAWAPDDVPTDVDPDLPDRYTAGVLTMWHAWAQGDTFGWAVTDPSGHEVESCWGFYGYWADDSVDGDARYTREVSGEVVQMDAAERVRLANLVGSGLIGLI